MQWFYDLKINRKLGLGFGVIAFFAVMLGLLAIYALYGLHVKADDALEVAKAAGISSKGAASADRISAIKAASDSSYVIFRNLIIGFMLFSIFLGWTIAGFVAGTITRSINILLDVANRLAEGDLTANIRQRSSDEIG